MLALRENFVLACARFGVVQFDVNWQKDAANTFNLVSHSIETLEAASKGVIAKSTCDRIPVAFTSYDVVNLRTYPFQAK